ncbi:MAG: hypothetical protein ACRDMX_18495 [Solirubrobacteraceae bacterium]
MTLIVIFNVVLSILIVAGTVWQLARSLRPQRKPGTGHRAPLARLALSVSARRRRRAAPGAPPSA